MSFEFYLPTRILFGAGELNNLHKQNLGGKKALLVISNGKSAKANGYLDRVEEQLKKAGLEFVLFNEVEPNPLKSTVMNLRHPCVPRSRSTASDESGFFASK